MKAQLALLVCAVAILPGCRKADPSPSGSAADAKAQIRQYLSKKAGQKEFAPGIDLELPGRVAMLRSNASFLEERTTALRASLRAADDEPTPLRKEIENLRGELATTELELGEARTRLQEAESRAPADATDIAARQQDRAAREAVWAAKRQELAAKETQFEAERSALKQKQAAMQRELQEAQRAFEPARAEAARQQQELSNQEDTYIRSVRQQLGSVSSYETLYRLIGQQLATADALLADPDISRRRMGLKIAREACGHANSGGVDVWLAARICEAYFWPNLELADAERRLDLLETSRRVFFDTYETNHVLTNYTLMLANAPDARAADMCRVQVADWLEEKGSVKHAAEILDEIRDAQVLASAAERITRVKERAAATR